MVKVETKVKTVTTASISAGEFFGYLIASDEKFAKLAEYATNIKIYVKIGGGGDYSNTDYEIDRENKIFIEITKESTI